jgi:alkanesulfonate monooxygenase SsuD/methylene tetrahydromethanopterin reductase-like flavin-dependent oxidoreductase (luciferase family)
MQIGISLQNNWGVEDVQSLVHLARQAEELGFASVWVHDHGFNAAPVFNRIGKVVSFSLRRRESTCWLARRVPSHGSQCVTLG